MMQIKDEKGWIKLLLCGFTLTVNHVLRDYVITAVSSISSGKGQTNEQWSNIAVGLALCSFHLGSTLTLITCLFLPKSILASKWIWIFHLIASAIVAFFSELSGSNASGFIILRLVQGLFQGLCYPVVYYVLIQEIPSISSVWSCFLVFYGPWLGSAFGLSLGRLQNPYICPYIFASLTLVLAIPVGLLGSKPDDEKVNVSWKEILNSLASWSCMIVQFSTTWALHTVAIGISFTSFYYNPVDDVTGVAYMIGVLFLISGLIFLLQSSLAAGLMKKRYLTALNRRRVIISSGALVTVLGLCLCGTVGLQSNGNLLGVSVIAIFGTVLSLVGVRLNLHDLGPLYPTPFLVLGCIFGSLGAFMASLLYPVIAKVDSSSPNKSAWQTAWLILIAPVLISAILHLFLVAVNPLLHQTTLTGILKTRDTAVLDVDGNVVSAGLPSKGTDSIDAKSFKSMKSALTFRTAFSRGRTRTVTFNTVMEDIDGDLQSAIDPDELRSIGFDSESDEVLSIRSGATSYKSANIDLPTAGKDFGVILSVENLDRTTAWLSTHHEGRILRKSDSSDEEKRAKKNVSISLLW